MKDELLVDDTIAAIATAFGEGGIGIVRISGRESKNILEQIFVPAQIQEEKLVNRRMTYGTIVHPESKKVIDEVLVCYMKSPHTYTREDVAEINCHGGVVPLRNTLKLILSRGARLAEPGEFTKRAFLNGRIDLVQAEAVIDLIKAKGDKGFDVALMQMEGSLSFALKNVRDRLMDILVQIAVNLDYPDEDIEEVIYGELAEEIASIKNHVDHLYETGNAGRIIKEGLRIAIVGKPNVGKSSLMNALLRDSRAIVTDIPGTTRDTIEEGAILGGIPVYLTDTAGIRETEDTIEKIGIEKSKDAFNKADLVLFILDGSQDLTKEDANIALHAQGKKVIALVNKSDLELRMEENRIREMLPEPDTEIMYISVKENQGIGQLEQFIENLVLCGEVNQSNSLIVTNVRHEDLLLRASEALADGLKMIESNGALDFLEVDIRRSWELLGEITGDSVAEDIIDEVFSRFCLGK